ncbi:hypothetical protein SAMN05444358_101771 [Ruegeria halocynthiae]|uniref:Uncharacterized protein n=1 Tax=Ruegeria halocynthiae TaxID=985054 RepID=A0A1H2TDV8_9RHOB|nr:hypothetical protein SAMN05444358_101771 [Ruegeria halocynthiae]
MMGMEGPLKNSDRKTRTNRRLRVRATRELWYRKDPIKMFPG